MSIFKRKKKPKKEYVYIDPELNIEEEFRRHKNEEKNEREFKNIEMLRNVHTQCQVMSEAADYIGELKIELQAVENYLSDVRIVSSQDKKTAAALRRAASKILEIKEKRKKLRKEKSKLTRLQNETMQRYESEFPNALINLQNEEKYCSAVKHDMNMLEAEKNSIREDIDNYIYKRNNIRNILVISLLGIVAVFIIFIASGQLKKESGQMLFTIVLLLSAVYAALMIVLLKRAADSFERNEKKIARAITLSNKTKIKYVNVRNSVDYLHEKYRVKNAYELSRIYEIYLDEKRKNERIMSASVELDEACGDFARLIGGLGLKDPEVWVAQMYSLVDEREMKELKRGLEERKNNLRERIDYNYDRIDKAKETITGIITGNPGLKDEIMEIVESYDR